ncbi:unnamed protein product [Microthlaspi erraticum]|uniref:Uncharacterized protein n=1 Tax=Microthlaspi erraticum TaxID=1685480 RepID=A0A6D2HUJ8_9BRAS|nr:unnamed protein product [Microthlaspi erraticum]
MDSSREANRERHKEERREDETSSLVDVNLMVVLLSQLSSTTNEDEKSFENERSVAHEVRESRARANKRFMKETKLMGKRTHVLQPMAKEFR